VFGYLDNRATGREAIWKELAVRALAIGREVIFFYAGTEQEINSAFDGMVRVPVGALVLSTDAF